jgi:hypothetical protein
MISQLWATANSGGLGVKISRSQPKLASAWHAAVVVAVLALAITPTAAAAPKPINGFIGGDPELGFGGLFTQPRDAVVYNAGTPTRADDKIFVVEATSANARVHRLDGDGNFELLWGKDVVRPGATGNSGEGYEVCTAADSGAAGCKFATEGPLKGEFDDPVGVAVSQVTGRVYVMDRGNRRVQEFDLDGAFVRAWGWDVAPEGAAGDTPGNEFEVCTDVCQAGAAGAGAGQFGGPGSDDFNALSTVAVSPVAPNDVFVTDPTNRRILQFESDGDFRRGWGFGVAGGSTFETCEATCQPGQQPSSPDPDDGGKFAFDEPQHIAIDSGGVVYASDTSANNRIVRFDSDPTPGTLLDPLPSSSLLSAGQTKGLEVDSITGNLLAARELNDGTVVIDEVADPDAELTGGPPNPSIVDTHVFSAEGIVRGLGWDPVTDRGYLSMTDLVPPPSGPFTGCVAEAPCHGLIVLAETTGPLAVAPQAPSDVGTGTALLKGSIDPGGGVARYQFQVSTDGTTWVDASAPAYVSGSSPVEVTVEASDLEPATLYRTRLVATKQTGISSSQSAISDESIFLTDAAAPRVSTLGASRRTDTSIRLRGVVDPQGSATAYRFEYGPANGSFDHHVPISDAQVGSGNSDQVVLQDVAGLQPGTAYHYRIVATNFVGTSMGGPVVFNTKSSPDVVQPPGRTYELISPSDKVSGVGAGLWFNGPTSAGLSGHAAHDGDRFAVQGTFGAVLVDGEYAFVNDWSLSERTPHGWINKPLISRRAHGSHTIVAITMESATDNMSLSSWSGTTVKLFAEMEDWTKEVVGATLYLRDWDQGRWELFGPTEETQGGGAGLGSSSIAANGKSAVASGQNRGLAGPEDPSLDTGAASNNVYLDEVPNGPSDVFPGAGVRSIVNVCTTGTEIPSRVDAAGHFKSGSRTCDQRQVVAVSATGGSFTLTFDGQTTATLQFDAPPSGPGSVQAALEALPNLAPGDVSVSQGPSDSIDTRRYVVHFAAGLGNVPSLTSDASLLTGLEPSITVVTTGVPVSTGGATLGPKLERVISSDGSRVFFMAPNLTGSPTQCSGNGPASSCPTQVYVRQRTGSGVATRWISRTEVATDNGASTDQDASLLGQAIFEGASRDGDKAFFRTNSPLTSDDPNGQGQDPPVGGITSGTASQDSWDLYMYDMPDAPGADPGDGELTRISGGPSGNSDCNTIAAGDPSDSVLRFVSDGGERLYFTCKTPLEGVSTAGSGTSTTPSDESGAANLYVYDVTSPAPNRWRFVTSLPTDSPIGPCATTAAQTGLPLVPNNTTSPKLAIVNSTNCVRGTPEGSFITLWTHGQLTDDDPDSESGDVYAYDAVEDELTRITAPQGGVGGSYLCALGTSDAPCYGDGGFGPPSGRTSLPALGVARDPHSGSRMVFFQSRSRLIPADKDSAYDVYQWLEGELTLISSALPETGDAYFKGNDRAGTNVYLATRDRLSWQDHDSVLDVYSARVGEGIPEPPNTNETCDPALDQCQGPGHASPPPGVDSDSGVAGNPPSPARVQLTLAAPSDRARRRAARTGKLRVSFRVSAPTTVAITARANVAGALKRVANNRTHLATPGPAFVMLQLSKPAVRKLKAGKTLRITLRAGAPGARAVTRQTQLRR